MKGWISTGFAAVLAVVFLAGCLAPIGLVIPGAFLAKEFGDPNTRGVVCECDKKTAFGFALRAAREIGFEPDMAFDGFFSSKKLMGYGDILSVSVEEENGSTLVTVRVKALLGRGEGIVGNFVATISRISSKIRPMEQITSS